MATTDSNGLVQLTVTDNIKPLETTFNLVTASVSAAITAVKPDLVYKANSLATANTKKNTLAAIGIVGTTTNPLLFYRTDESALYTWNGTAWTRLSSKQLVTQAADVTLYSGNASPETGASVAITFPTAFTTRPEVFATTTQDRLTLSVRDVTTTGCTIGFRNNSSSAQAGPITARWSAIGYTS